MKEEMGTKAMNLSRHDCVLVKGSHYAPKLAWVLLIHLALLTCSITHCEIIPHCKITHISYFQLQWTGLKKGSCKDLINQARQERIMGLKIWYMGLFHNVE